MTGIVLRPAGPGDAQTIVGQRRAMFVDMGVVADARLEAMCAAFAPWVARRLASGEYSAWLAVAPNGEVVGGAGVWVMDWPPHMYDPAPRRGNLLNVYVAPAHRRQGVARRLVETALDWCRRERLGVVILHASDAGRPLYAALGFQPTNEMRLLLADAA